MASNNIRGD